MSPAAEDPGRTDAAAADPVGSEAAAGTVSVVRTGAGTFRGTNARGAEVEIGDGEGRFRPGELLKLALAGCAAMSSEFTLGRRLGEDHDAEFVVSGAKGPAGNRYEHLTEEIRLNLSGLDDAARARVAHLVQRAIAQACTVERSVSAGIGVDHHLVDTARMVGGRPLAADGRSSAAPPSEEQPS